MNQQQIMQAFVTWAKSKGISPPSTQAGRKVLFARFMTEMNARAEQVIGQMQAAQPPQSQMHGEIGGEDPLHLSTDGATVQIEDVRHGDYSDFDKLIDDRQHAMHQAGGDDLAMNIIHRNKEQEELQDQAKFMRINPSSILTAQLGNQALVTSGPDLLTNVSNAINVAAWAGDNAETVPVTVTVNPVSSVGPPSGAKLSVTQVTRPFMVLQWGTKGFMTNVEIDIGLGTQLTINASSVNVGVALDSTLAPTDPTAASQMTLAGMLSFWPCVRTKPIVRTRYIDASLGSPAPITAPVFVDVPAFSKDVTFFQDPTSSGATLDFLGRKGASRYQVTIAAGAITNATFFDAPFLLNGEITIIKVTPTGGGFNFASLVFGLSL